MRRRERKVWKGSEKRLPLSFCRSGRFSARLILASSLPNLHVIGGKKAVGASADASPPALVDHLDVGDDVVGVEGDLVVARCRKKRGEWERSSTCLQRSLCTVFPCLLEEDQLFMWIRGTVRHTGNTKALLKTSLTVTFTSLCGLFRSNTSVGFT